MTGNIKNILFWMPLVVGGIAIALTGILALFLYGSGRSIWQAFTGLLTGLLPALILGAAIALHWH